MSTSQGGICTEDIAKPAAYFERRRQIGVSFVSLSTNPLTPGISSV